MQWKYCILFELFVAWQVCSASVLLRVAEPLSGVYIVKLAAQTTPEQLAQHVQAMASQLVAFGEDQAFLASVRIYSELAKYGFPAYSAHFSDTGLFLALGDKNVEYIEQDQPAHAYSGIFDRIGGKLDRFLSRDNKEGSLEEEGVCAALPNGLSKQEGATWGIARTTNCKGRNGCPTGNVCANNCNYYYETGRAGAGTFAYVLDTGIYCAHNDFVNKARGLCLSGANTIASAVVKTTEDGNGHGTHCASTIAGQVYGVAKEATVVAVKVLDDSGSGAYSDVIAGIDWTAGNATGKLAVASMSLGGGKSTSLNAAVNALTLSGTLVIVAAGNENANACNFSPASASAGVSVAATNRLDARTGFSNFGTCVDIFAPGAEITAAYIGSPDTVAALSGTSMACPHVAGAACKQLSTHPAMTSTQLKNSLIGEAITGQVVGPGPGSPNRILYAVCKQLQADIRPTQ